MKNVMCKKYRSSEALPNEDGKCSLCEGDCLEAPTSPVFTIKTKVTGEQIDNVLSTAFEGGSNYWVREVRILGRTPRGCQYSSEAISRKGKLKFIEHEEDKNGKPLTHVLTLPKMLKGISLFIEHGYEFDDGMDAGQADICLQFALFGKIIYG